jgi:kinesin family protein 1
VHATTAIFSITLNPAPSKRAGDLWRLDTRHQYVKGEEELAQWSPRGISLLQDYISAVQRRTRVTEVDAAKASLARLAPPSPTTSDDEIDLTPADKPHPYTPHQMQLLDRALALWRTQRPILSGPAKHLATPPMSPPASTAPNARLPPSKLHPLITPHPKNPTVLKTGALLVPTDAGASSWLRRQAELRPPYLHLHSVPDGAEVSVLNLRHATVDADPEIGRLLQSERVGVGNVFAVYGVGTSVLFAVRTEQAKAEWIWAIDRAFMGPGNEESEEEEEDEYEYER